MPEPERTPTTPSATAARTGDWIAYWNGRFVRDEEIHISPWDRGFILGDAAFEATRTYRHVPFHLDWHLDRLFASLEVLRIDPGLTRKAFTDLTLAVLDRNRPRLAPDDDVSITHRVTRGLFAGLFSGPPATPPTVLITCRPVAFARFAAYYASGIELRTPSLRLPASGGIDPRIKTQSRLHLVLGDVEMWQYPGHVEPLFADTNGYVTETAATNVFFVLDGMIVTPPDETVLGGVTRRAVIDMAGSSGMPMVRRPVHLDDIHATSEAFLTSTSFGILPIRQVNDRLLDPIPGPVTSTLTAAFCRHVGVDIIEQSRAHV